MQFLKTVFWVILAVAIAIFARENWKPVTINLWGGLQADIILPVLVIGSFLLGFVPLWIATRIGRWQASRRIAPVVQYTPAPPLTEQTQVTPDGVMHSHGHAAPPIAGGA